MPTKKTTKKPAKRVTKAAPAKKATSQKSDTPVLPAAAESQNNDIRANPKGLTPKQVLFVAQYLANGLNATQAAIAAGYSARTAESQGSRLLRNVKVAAAIAEAQAPTFKRLELTKEYVLETIISTVERCKQAEQVVYRGWPVEGQYQFDSMGVMKGAELLGKHLKMFTDKVDHTHKITLEDLLLGTDEAE